jgi:CHAT domain-containing protein/predicted negative regulator of RcsB-dependent stress response
MPKEEVAELPLILPSTENFLVARLEMERAKAMSSLAYRCLLLLALGLNANGHGITTRIHLQSSDEQAVRELTEQYAAAVSSADLEAMRRFWNQLSPNMGGRLKTYQIAFSRARFHFIRKNVTVEISADKAVSQLTTDERQLDRETGISLPLRDMYHGVCRSFEWVRTSGGWKIEREWLVQEELAARLESAASDAERDEILKKEKVFVTDVLVGALVTRGQRHRVRSEFDAALLCFRLQREVAERIGDPSGFAGAFLEMGMTRNIQFEFDQALTLFQKSLALFQRADIKRGIALVLENASQVYFATGDDGKAYDSAQKALQLFEDARDHKGMGSALLDLASIYGDQNNFQQALSCIEKAMALAQSADDKIQIAMLRTLMAQQYSGLGDYDRAREVYEEILKQTEGYGDRVGAAIIRNAIGDICAEQGRYQDALDFYQKALSSFESADYRGGLVTASFRISQVFLAQGKFAEAAPPAERAISVARRLGKPNFLRVALTEYGYAQLGLNDPAKARSAFAEAISITEKLREQTAGGIDENRRFLEGRLRAYQGMFGLLVKEKQPREALAFAERTKARVLLDVLENGKMSIQKTMTPEEREHEHKLTSNITVLNKQLARAAPSDQSDQERVNRLAAQLEKARLDYEAFQTALFAAHPELKVHRGEAPIIKTEELASLLPDRSSALLEYVVEDDRCHLFVVTKAAADSGVDIQLFTLPVKRAQLAQQTELFRQQLASRDLGFRASAAKLYDLLLRPAQAQLKGKTNLVIVPDDKLWELPFQALMSRADRFLIEDSAVSYAPSLTVLREMMKRRRELGPSSETILALGNPTVGKQTLERATLASRDRALAPLPEAEQEVKALAHLYGAAHTKVYIGADAREDRVKREAGQADILHFATHGTLSDASPMYSHLVLAEGDGNEDGLLEAWEIMQLDLKADLAILSACETARGRYSAGEGMIGLTWAMFVAGVPATVVSQWKVEAASTRDLLLAFHRNLLLNRGDGKLKITKAEALREAALKIIRNPQLSHPFYWAGFVLVGDGE